MILLAVKVPSSNKHLIFPSILFTDNQWQEAVFEKCKKRVKAHSREAAVGTKLSERHLWLVHQFTSVAKVATISLVSFRQERVTCMSKPKQTRGDNAAQTRSKWEFVFFFFEVFGENFNFWCMFFPGASAPISSRFLYPRPPLLLSAPNQNRHATQARWMYSSTIFIIDAGE